MEEFLIPSAYMSYASFTKNFLLYNEDEHRNLRVSGSTGNYYEALRHCVKHSPANHIKAAYNANGKVIGFYWRNLSSLSGNSFCAVYGREGGFFVNEKSALDFIYSNRTHMEKIKADKKEGIHNCKYADMWNLIDKIDDLGYNVTWKGPSCMDGDTLTFELKKKGLGKSIEKLVSKKDQDFDRYKRELEAVKGMVKPRLKPRLGSENDRAYADFSPGWSKNYRVYDDDNQFLTSVCDFWMMRDKFIRISEMSDEHCFKALLFTRSDSTREGILHFKEKVDSESTALMYEKAFNYILRVLPKDDDKFC
jgi:hypothetical protein